MNIKLPAAFTGSFNYIDCGAVGDRSNPLLQNFSDAHYIGFDPALSVPDEKDDCSVYFPVAVGKKSGEAEFHRTHNLNCSSFYLPNREFLDRFMTIGEFFNITDTVQIKVVALDEYLPHQGINDVDFIELDTQGSELDILQGAKGLLASGILGLRVEVEFSPMYHNQPLFAEVDSHLRQFDFMLFDLERYHLRRKTAPANVLSREQIVWGQALYFKDWKNTLSYANPKQKLCKLAVIASFYGFHSYAFEIMGYLLSDDAEVLTPDEKGELRNIYHGSTLVREMTGQERFIALTKKLYWHMMSSWRRKKNMAVNNRPNDDYFWKD